MTKGCQCEKCEFKNPTPTTSAVIIKDGKLLLVKRNQEPYLGRWDFPGGYMNDGESPLQCIKREIKEELSCESNATYIGCFPGYSTYKHYNFPITSFVFLVELHGKIKLDHENSAYSWFPLKGLSPDMIAFDSNQDILKYIKREFGHDFKEVKKLRLQLGADEMSEHQFHKSIINGHLETVYNQGKLIGMGWLFWRDTSFHRQGVIEDMIVDQKKRHIGTGEYIVRRLLQWAKDIGCDTVDLTTHPRRIPANNLYKKVGFKFHETNHYLIRFNAPK